MGGKILSRQEVARQWSRKAKRNVAEGKEGRKNILTIEAERVTWQMSRGKKNQNIQLTINRQTRSLDRYRLMNYSSREFKTGKKNPHGWFRECFNSVNSVSGLPFGCGMLSYLGIARKNNKGKNTSPVLSVPCGDRAVRWADDTL